MRLQLKKLKITIPSVLVVYYKCHKAISLKYFLNIKFLNHPVLRKHGGTNTSAPVIVMSSPNLLQYCYTIT